MKDAEVKSEGGDRREGKAHFKKKGGNKNKGKEQQQSTADEAFRGIGFSIHREGPELYLRTIERLRLYISSEHTSKCMSSTTIHYCQGWQGL